MASLSKACPIGTNHVRFAVEKIGTALMIRAATVHPFATSAVQKTHSLF
jgi:hypothetical protein